MVVQSQISNAGLRSIASLPRLRWLDLHGCHRLSAKGLASLAEGRCAKSLARLSLHSCSGIGDEDLMALCQPGAKLAYLLIRDCRRVTPKAVRDLKAFHPNPGIVIGLD